MTDKNDKPPPKLRQNLRAAWQLSDITLLFPSMHSREPRPGTPEHYSKRFDEAFGDHNSPEEIRANERVWELRSQDRAANDTTARPWYQRPFLPILKEWQRRNERAEQADPWRYRLHSERAKICWDAALGRLSDDEANRLLREADKRYQTARNAFRTPDPD